MTTDFTYFPQNTKKGEKKKQTLSNRNAERKKRKQQLLRCHFLRFFEDIAKI